MTTSCDPLLPRVKWPPPPLIRRLQPPCTPSQHLPCGHIPPGLGTQPPPLTSSPDPISQSPNFLTPSSALPLSLQSWRPPCSWALPLFPSTSALYALTPSVPDLHHSSAQPSTVGPLPSLFPHTSTSVVLILGGFSPREHSAVSRGLCCPVWGRVGLCYPHLVGRGQGCS